MKISLITAAIAVSFFSSKVMATDEFYAQSFLSMPYEDDLFNEDSYSYTSNLLSEKNIELEASEQRPFALLSWEEAYVKAEALVGQMSLEQKVNITTGVGWMSGPCVGNSGRTTKPDFPELCLQDSPLGIRMADGVSSGVAGVNAAASFDKEAIRRRGEYMGQEFRGKGVHVQLGPSMNIMRGPFGGRNWEAFGEDPYLVGIASSETIIGIQSQGVMAVAKHLIGNEQETNRLVHSVNIDEKAIQEVYLWPFARSVEAGVASVMCSYNKFGGVYACESDYAINKLLKGQLGFKGFVQSDWSATHSTEDSANHGLDMTMPGDIAFNSGDSYFGANLTMAVNNGKVPASRVTDMATRIVAAWYKLGQDKEFPETNFHSFHPEKGTNVDVQGDHKIEIRQMATASTVLLKNVDNILPLTSTNPKKLAIIGTDAGSDTFGSSCEDHGCSNGTLAQGWGSGAARFPYLIAPVDGIRQRAGNSMLISEHLEDYDTVTAAKVASEADVAMVFINSDSGEEFITVEGHKGDRLNLDAWHNGDNLVKAVADANSNTIVVVHAVGPINMPWIDHPNIKALVWPGLPGQESGNSLADILFGDVNPSGRLPYTIAKNIDHYNVRISHKMEFKYEEGVDVGYRWFDKMKIEPLFEFGYGLSYTQFEYKDFQVIPLDSSASDSVHMTAMVTIRNSGKYDGAEIPQAYITFPEVAHEPPKVLRGFEKVHIEKDSEKQVTFEFKKTELSYYDTESSSWVVPKGDFILHIGSSSRLIHGSSVFSLN